MEGREEEKAPLVEAETSILKVASPQSGAQRHMYLIDTHRLGAEPPVAEPPVAEPLGAEPLVAEPPMAEPPVACPSVYFAPQYQSHMELNAPQQKAACWQSGGGGGGGTPQLLNPSALLSRQSVEPRLGPPDLLLHPENILQALGETGVSDCCETTFIEGPAQDASSTKEVLLFAEGKFLDFSGEDAKINTLSYDIDDDDEFQEFEVRN